RGAQLPIALDRQPMSARFEPADADSVVRGFFAARERQMLRVSGVDRNRQHGRFSAGDGPIAARAPCANVQPDLTGALDVELALVLGSRGAEPERGRTRGENTLHGCAVSVISARTSSSVGTPFRAPRRVQLTAAAAFAVRSASPMD